VSERGPRARFLRAIEVSAQGRKFRWWEERHRQWLREEEERHRIRNRKESREELFAVIEAWGEAKRLEESFVDAEQRAAGLGLEDRQLVVDRLQRARALLWVRSTHFGGSAPGRPRRSGNSGEVSGPFYPANRTLRGGRVWGNPDSRLSVSWGELSGCDVPPCNADLADMGALRAHRASHQDSRDDGGTSMTMAGRLYRSSPSEIPENPAGVKGWLCFASRSVGMY
jgi:hypothetical protein